MTSWRGDAATRCSREAARAAWMTPKSRLAHRLPLDVGGRSVETHIREVRLQGQHYFSIALGAILATGSVAMLMHGPRAADARAHAPEQREGAMAKAGAPAAAVATPGQR